MKGPMDSAAETSELIPFDFPEYITGQPHLKGKVALVIGGTRGLGADIAMALAHGGAHVVVTYSSSEAKARDYVTLFEKAHGSRAMAFKHDPGDTKHARDLIDGVLKSFKCLDILIHTASIALHGKTIDDPTINVASMDLQWQVNVHGYIALVRAAAPHLRTGGRIIALSSGVASRVGIVGIADYAGTKAAVLGYTKGVARDLGARGVTANVVLAGMLKFDTPRGSKRTPRLNDPSPDAMSDEQLRAAEVVQAVMYLITACAKAVNGTALDVTGGYLA